jgi:hypothetical protein
MGSSMSFEGLTAEQLDNYSEPRSRSNVYSRQRLEVKEMLLGASGPLAEQLREQGHDFDVLASDHHPCLWNKKVVDRQYVFFSRGKEEQAKLERLVDHDRSLASTLMDPTPYFTHAFMCWCVSAAGVELVVKLHWRAWVDRDNFLARLDEDSETQAFLDLVGGLPEEYAIGVEGGPSHPATELDGQKLDEVLDAFRESRGMLTVGLAFDPERAEELGPDLTGVASVAFLLLVPVYEVLSWSEEDDFITLSEREQAIDEQKRAVTEAAKQEREAFESRRRERHEEQARRFEEQRAEKLEHQAYRAEVRRAAREAARRAAEEEAAREAEARRQAEEAAREPEPAPRQPAAPTRERIEARPTSKPRRPRPAPPFEIRPGARVEITSGVMKGKWGVIQELDSHGQAKVVLGSLVARIAVTDLREPRYGRRPRR